MLMPKSDYMFGVPDKAGRKVLRLILDNRPLKFIYDGDNMGISYFTFPNRSNYDRAVKLVYGAFRNDIKTDSSWEEW